MVKITHYFENYQEAYNYYGGTNVPSKEIALVGDASYVFVSSDNAGDGGNTQYFDAAMTNDEIVATQVNAAYVSGTTQGYEQGYNEGYPLGYTAGHEAGYSEGEAAGYTTGHTAGYAEGEADYIAGMIENGTMAITTTSQVDVMEYAYAQVSDANLTAGNIADGVTILGVTGTYSGGSLDPTSSIVTDASKWQVYDHALSVPQVAGVTMNDQPIETMDVEGYAEVIASWGDPNAIVIVDKFNPRGSGDDLSGIQDVSISYQRNDPEDPDTNAYISIDIDNIEEGESVGLSFANLTEDEFGSYFLDNIYWCIDNNTNNNHWLMTANVTGTYTIRLDADGNGGCSMTITVPEPEP